MRLIDPPFTWPVLTSGDVSRKAAKAAHPDKGGSEKQMAALNEAYEVLSKEGMCPSRLETRPFPT